MRSLLERVDSGLKVTEAQVIFKLTQLLAEAKSIDSSDPLADTQAILARRLDAAEGEQKARLWAAPWAM